MSAMMGARRNRSLLEFAGTMTSFKRSLKTSAKG
jgi:hypothetical protein